MNIKALFTLAKKGIADNAPTILTALGAAGVVTTAVSAARAHVRARDVSESASLKEHVKLTWKFYVPAVLSGAASITCIIAANQTHLRRHAALLGAYSIGQDTLLEYRQEIEDLLGKDKLERVDASVAERKTKKNPPSESNTVIMSSGDALIYDQFSGRYFRGDVEKVRKAVNDLNQIIIRDSYADLNTFYNLLDVEETQMGSEFGFTCENLFDVEFDAHLGPNGNPCLLLRYETYPVRDYWKFAR